MGGKQSKIELHESSTCEKEFEEVKTIFEDSFNRSQIGAGFCVIIDNKIVVDLVGGLANKKTKKVYDRTTLTSLHSSTKNCVNFVIAMLVSQGQLSYEEKISKYWPEFGCNGKENITLKQLMMHNCGIYAFEEICNVELLGDLDRLSTFLAKAKPLYEPGTRTAYHAATRGLYANEIVRRVDPQKRTIGQIMREVNQKTGTNFVIGFKEDEFERMATMYPAYGEMAYLLFRVILQPLIGCCFKKVNTQDLVKNMLFFPKSIAHRSIFALTNDGKEATQAGGLANEHNKEYQRCEVTGGNGFANAISLAKLAHIFCQKGTFENHTFFDEETYAKCEIQEGKKLDEVMNQQIQFFQGGFGLLDEIDSKGNKWKGWTGVGGSICVWDNERKISIGYVRNKMTFKLVDPDAFLMLSKVIEIYDKIKKTT